MKFAVLSFLVPPSASGSTMALYHLLKGFRGDEYCLISQQDDASEKTGMRELLSSGRVE
jgi:hypothetical protein